MSRHDTFNSYYDGNSPLVLFTKIDNADLLKIWKQSKTPIPPIDWGASRPKMSDRMLRNVQTVERRYAYRWSNLDFGKLPPFFRRMMILGDDDGMLDLLFLGTLGVLSAAMPWVQGSLFKEVVRPNLYIFVTGAAASGKGKIGLCRTMAESLDEHLQTQFRNFILQLFGLPVPDDEAEPAPAVPKDDDKALSDKEKQQAQKQRREQEKQMDEAAKKITLLQRLFIPANASATAVYEALSENMGMGLIFESEADTLTSTFRREGGQFSEGLRKAFHNEPIEYMRRTRRERVYIKNPFMSMVLTGTPNQMPRMLQSAENGLFSRMLFYRLTTTRESFLEDELDDSLTGEQVADYCHVLGRLLSQFFDRLKSMPTGITFSLNAEQKHRFMSFFHDLDLEYQQLFAEGYDSAEAVENVDSTMKRLGNICYRIMMVLSVSRHIEDAVLPDHVECHPSDFDTVMRIAPILMHHAHIAYDDMLEATGAISESQLEFSDSPDLMNDSQRGYFKLLPDEFTMQEALIAAQKADISRRTAYNHIDLFVELGILTKTAKGRYQKGRVQLEEDMMTDTGERSLKILSIIKENPSATIEDIIKQSGLSRNAVKYDIEKLKKSGRIQRIGDKKNGKWAVNPS